ncbi:dihydrodipicolinate synthase family protein, partial [Streptomyces sp. NPDC059627]
MSSVAFETQRAALADVVAIPVTPFAADGGVDQDAHRALLRRLLDGGVRTLTPNGNTGEFYALAPEERRLRHRSRRDEGAG